MADMECYWREFVWPSVQFGITQIATPLFKVFSGELERMQDRPLDGCNFGESAAEPRFWQMNFGHLPSLSSNYALMRIPKNER
jgi:hypothetical protein